MKVHVPDLKKQMTFKTWMDICKFGEWIGILKQIYSVHPTFLKRINYISGITLPKTYHVFFLFIEVILGVFFSTFT